uniref:Uncharacterized protein n=1 Tax=Lepeophtheirus salmonis TaxID=72036 RepID=A0A0K2VC80_LEPSM
MNAGIGDISDSMDEDMKGKTDTLSVKEPKMMPEDKSSDKPKEKKSYDFVDDSCDDWMDTRKGDISDAMGEEVKGRTDTISVKEPKMTPEDKSSDKCKEKKSYDFVDDSCDDWMNAGIGDISDSMDEDMKVKTDTLSVKEANTIPEEKSSDNPKEKKSYDFVGDSCDDGMDPGIGNISDSMDEEVKGRTDTLSIKEPKMMPEDKSSDKSKEKKSYDFVDDSCDHNMNAGIGGTFYSNEAYLNENKNSKSVLQDLIRCSPDKQTESQKKERTYSSIASHLVTEVKMENSDINVTSNYSSYPALIVVVEDNKPKLEKELDSEGYETVLTKKERRRKLNSLRLSATECEDSLKEIEEIINSDIDRNIRCSSFPQPADVNTFSTNEIIPSKIETDDNQIDCVRPFEPKDPNESAVKEEYQNELTRVPVDNVSNNTSIMENVLLKNDEKSNHTINEVKEKTVKVVDSTDENVFTKEHTSFLKKEMTQILDHTELAHIPMKNNSQEASDCLNEFLVQSIDTGNLCNQESSSTYKNEKINHEKLNIPPLEKVVNKYSNDDNCSSVTSNSGSYVPLRRILSSSSVNNALKEKSEFSATMINLDHESNDIIRNIASKSTSSTRPSSRSSFSEDRFDSARRYSFKKRDSMDLSSGFSSSRVSPMNTTSRQYVRIRDLRSSGTESVNNNIDDITKINTNEEGNVGSPSLNTDSQINEKLVKSVDKVDTEIEVIHLSSKFEMVKKISGISMKNFNESLFNEEVDDCGKSLSRNNYESRDSKAEGHIFTMDNMSNEEAKFSSSFVSTDILSQQIQITSDKDSSTEIDFENISGKKKKSKKRMKHSVDVGSSKTSTSEDVYVCEIKEMDSKSSCLKDTNLDRQQPVSSLSSMDESTMKHFDQMKDKVIKKRKRPRNILSKSYNNIESTTTDSDEMKGESECKEEVIDDNEDSSPILADVNLNDLADSLIEEDEDKIMAEEQSLTSISADDEEFEELMMNSSEKVLWSTLARVPPRPPSPIPIEEKNKDSSSSVSRNTQFCLRTKEHLTTPMNKKIFDKDGYEIHVSRRTRTNSRNSQIELDENVIPLSQLKPAPIKSILDVAKDDGHFNILRDNPDERSQEDKLFKVDVKEKSILPDIVPSHKFNSKNILNLENVLDEESKASRRISSHDDAIISVSNLRVRGPQLIDTSNINIDYKSKSELIRNLQLDIFSHFMLQSSLTDAELKMSQLLMKENCSKNDIKCSLNESLNDGCCKASSNICRSKELSHISIESKSLSTPNYSELALRDNSDNNNCDDKTIGKYSLESEEVGVMKMSNFQVLVSELSEDVTDLGILLKGLNENDISEAIASTQYALKSVNEFNKEADKLELRIKESGLNSSEVSSLTNEIFDVKKEIKSFDNKVKSLEISMQNYMKDSQSRKEEIRKYHSLLLDLEGWCDGIQLTNKIEPAQAKDYYTKSLNSAKVLEYDLNSQSQELSSLIHEAQALSEFGDVKKMSETLIKRLKDLKAIVDHTSSMLPERINILKVQKRSSRNVSFVST